MRVPDQWLICPSEMRIGSRASWPAGCLVRGVRVDEVVDILVHFVVGPAVDVDDVTRIVIGKADVLADRGFELHVGDGLFDAVEGCGDIVVSAQHEDFLGRFAASWRRVAPRLQRCFQSGPRDGRCRFLLIQDTLRSVDR